MAKPNSKASLKEYIKRKLGAPVLEVNVDDDQIDDRIDEALQYFHEYHYDGSIRTYLKFQLSSARKSLMRGDTTETESSAGTHDYADDQFKEQNNYIVLPESVLSVNKVFPYNDSASSVNMFDVRYQLRLNDIYDLSSTNVLYYSMVQQQLSMLDEVLTGRPPIRYSAHQNRLYIDVDWESVDSNSYLLIECFRKIDPTDFTDIYDDLWLKRYATALTKYQWGENLSKFSGIALPGGVTLDAQQMKDEAQEEIRRLEEESRSNYEMPIIDLMG